jgi:hypothetical protein
MKSILKTTLSILFTVLLLVSCNSGNNNKTIDDLVTHLNNNEFKGEKSEKAFAMIGAMDGIGYKGETFSVEIYKFKDAKNIPDMLTYKNGNFGMIVHKPSESERTKLIETFNSFK